MRIAIVSTFYSEGMGYTENCLPKALALLGHEVHLVTSNLNVYGNESSYQQTYAKFLGPADQGVGSKEVDGYRVHRVQSRNVGGYIWLPGVGRSVRAIDPDVVHSLEIASLQTYWLALAGLFGRFALFAESHQHMSVVKPYLRQRRGSYWKKLLFALTRTLPTALASTRVHRCYAIAPDCVEVAQRYYGVPMNKLKLQSLGTDLEVFSPAVGVAAVEKRNAGRAGLGLSKDDIVCIYTGRLSEDKNPLLLARAIDILSRQGRHFQGLFVGEGVQRSDIAACGNTQILPFVTHRRLAELYRLSDIAVWPAQESMSMLDAAASGLPLVVSNRIGESERVIGNGRSYIEGDAEDLARTLASLEDAEMRKAMGEAGRKKMATRFNWQSIAKVLEADFMAAVRH
jgi:glycosyltransferase involved in cell wall biosynthesis